MTSRERKVKHFPPLINRNPYVCDKDMADNELQQSNLKQFLTSIATVKGDLSNISAPPFVLADKSTTEFPRYWIEHPDLFCAPAQESTPERRILAVSKWFLSSLRNQQYAGRDPSQGVKKPLNAFLGELFIGECGSEGEECRLVSEQVSHHPPVTACYLWNEKHGIRAEGYTRQEITFTGSVNIQQIGQAILHIDEYDEDYLIPLPNVRVKGILSGGPYPELQGSYSIVSLSGFLAEFNFSGKGLLGVGGKKNHVEATIYRQECKKRQDIIFTIEGSWAGSFTVKDAHGKEIDKYDVASAPVSTFHTQPLDKQDPWESHKAWAKVIKSIHSGDMQGIVNNKTQLEDAQRELRKNPQTSEDAWEPLFFRKESNNPVAEKLLAVIGESLDTTATCGDWRFDGSRAANLQRPWRGDLTPFGQGHTS